VTGDDDNKDVTVGDDVVVVVVVDDTWSILGVPGVAPLLLLKRVSCCCHQG
jgi:hypothetical protein